MKPRVHLPRFVSPWQKIVDTQYESFTDGYFDSQNELFEDNSGYQTPPHGPVHENEKFFHFDNVLSTPTDGHVDFDFLIAGQDGNAFQQNTPKTSFATPELPSPGTSPTNWNDHESSLKHPSASDKESWFPDWELHKAQAYDLLVHLPESVCAANIAVEFIPASHNIKFDATNATLHYEKADVLVQVGIRVHVETPTFVLHDIFFAWNDKESPKYLPQDLEYGPFLGTTFSYIGRSVPKHGGARGGQTPSAGGSAEHLAPDLSTVDWIKANNIDLGLGDNIFYIYSFRPANHESQSLAFASSIPAPRTPKLVPFSDHPALLAYLVMSGASTLPLKKVRLGAGTAQPLRRCIAARDVADPFSIRHWRVVGNNQHLQEPDFVAKVKSWSVFEAISAEEGPPLAGLSNFRRWGLGIDPIKGLILRSGN